MNRMVTVSPCCGFGAMTPALYWTSNRVDGNRQRMVFFFGVSGGLSDGHADGNGCSGEIGGQVKCAMQPEDAFSHSGAADPRSLASLAKSGEDFGADATTFVGDFNDDIWTGYPYPSERAYFRN